MSSFISGHDHRVAELLDAMGLPTTRLKRVVIDMSVARAVTVTTYGYATVEDVAAAKLTMQQFRLVEKKPKAKHK